MFDPGSCASTLGAMGETIGARVQRLAAEAGDKPAGKHLAKAIGVSFETLRLWTVGETAPKRERAQMIADYLGTSVEVVMYGADPPPRKLDAEAIADAFDAVPARTESELDQREWLYNNIIGQIATHCARLATLPAQPPAAQTTEPHPPAGETPP